MVEKTFSQVFDVNKRPGKILIAGDEGSGKTLEMCCFGVEKMLNGIKDCWKSYDKIDEYNAMGYNFSKNFEHLVFSNTKINCSGTRIPTFESYDFDPFRVGLYSPDYETDLYPPGAVLLCDEAHIPFNAYMWQYVRPEVSAFWTTSRQWDISLIMATNRPNMVVNFIRDLCNRIFYCLPDFEEIKQGNVVVGNKLHVLEFNSNASFERFLKTGKKENCEEYKLRVPCRYGNYDTAICRYLHLKGREIADFCIKRSNKIETIEDVEEFTNTFGTVIPEGYYVKPSARAKKEEKPEVSSDIDENEDFVF